MLEVSGLSLFAPPFRCSFSVPYPPLQLLLGDKLLEVSSPFNKKKLRVFDQQNYHVSFETNLVQLNVTRYNFLPTSNKLEDQNMYIYTNYFTLEQIKKGNLKQLERKKHIGLVLRLYYLLVC